MNFLIVFSIFSLFPLKIYKKTIVRKMGDKFRFFFLFFFSSGQRPPYFIFPPMIFNTLSLLSYYCCDIYIKFMRSLEIQRGILPSHLKTTFVERCWRGGGGFLLWALKKCLLNGYLIVCTFFLPYYRSTFTRSPVSVRVCQITG